MRGSYLGEGGTDGRTAPSPGPCPRALPGRTARQGPRARLAGRGPRKPWAPGRCWLGDRAPWAEFSPGCCWGGGAGEAPRARPEAARGRAGPPGQQRGLWLKPGPRSSTACFPSRRFLKLPLRAAAPAAPLPGSPRRLPRARGPLRSLLFRGVCFAPFEGRSPLSTEGGEAAHLAGRPAGWPRGGRGTRDPRPPPPRRGPGPSPLPVPAARRLRATCSAKPLVKLYGCRGHFTLVKRHTPSPPSSLPPRRPSLAPGLPAAARGWGGRSGARAVVWGEGGRTARSPSSGRLFPLAARGK